MFEISPSTSLEDDRIRYLVVGYSGVFQARKTRVTDRRDFSRQPHYHIRWTRSGLLDWQRFREKEEADANTRELAHDREGCAIEKFDGTCARRAAAAVPNLTRYPSR